MTTAAFRFCRTPLLWRLGQQLRGVTVRSSQYKLEERFSLPSTEKFRAAKPDKTPRAFDPARPQHLHDAHNRITACSRRRDYDGAWAAFKEIEAPDDDLRIVALGICQKALWWDEACRVWAAISTKNASAYNTMIDLCARLRRSNDAEAFVGQMRREGFEVNFITYTTLIKAYSNAGETIKALDTFNAMQPMLEGTSETARQIAYQVVMAAFSRQGDYATTRELFVRMTEAGVPPDRGHYHSLMAACARSADADTAQQVFDIMPQAGLAPDEQSYTVLISCSRFNLQRCLELVQQMTAAGLRPTRRTYQELLEAHVLARDAKGARELVAQAPGLDLNSRKIRDLLSQIEAM